MEKNFLYKEIKKAVMAVLPESRVLIYGSYARNEEREESDIDIMIIADSELLSEQKRQEVRYAVYDVEFKYYKVMSPKVLTSSEWNKKKISHPYYETVCNEGIEI
ncbi:MAG: nucleotidyltransferase domain-containing protein [Bacteroidia bacterium]